MLSLYISSSLMVVNLIEALIFPFSFLTSSSSLCMFLSAILSDKESFLTPLLSLLLIFLFLRGSSSSFCSLAISFSKLLFFVLSLIFSLVSRLLRSKWLCCYSWAWYCPAAWPSVPDSWRGGTCRRAPNCEGPVFSYLTGEYTSPCWVRAAARFCGRVCSKWLEWYHILVFGVVGFGGFGVLLFVFLRLEGSLGLVLAFESDHVFSLLSPEGFTIMRVIYSFCNSFFII